MKNIDELCTCTQEPFRGWFEHDDNCKGYQLWREKYIEEGGE